MDEAGVSREVNRLEDLFHSLPQLCMSRRLDVVPPFDFVVKRERFLAKGPKACMSFVSSWRSVLLVVLIENWECLSVAVAVLVKVLLLHAPHCS